ncbi:putative ribosome biogenesis GTPase RsgA [Gottschalkia acidurici 9a]|uniref:Small ribosomal subunit biogenesis GTPase RsgA n=1 Tax=Gottschalkia acidurici (strain ATCC 7906 / DSM 604 / BCRC 14475 / CIP 104303 / KCTC 5404 / NCIMB 10678 / 9a) TaxID=1128398 RepID=K0AZI6_GOTA9|nr:ribosome small subunit-dependent GTPase A [Gottschalkia acidurici]AFS78684.1 putative ribosome biogenesis GTPase RsgA [Gottschalkia acidurici 9a]
MLEGTIIKGIGGFYYVKVENITYECRARGLFRKEKIKPQVGDRVLIRVNDQNKTGYVEKIFERTTELIRPPVSNVNQAIIVFAIKKPDPNLWLLDRFLLLASCQNLDVVICLNKIDLATEEEVKEIYDIYSKSGYKIITTSNKDNIGIDEIREILKDKITVFAGPSGVGKSTLLNSIQPNLKLKTGEISTKTSRGKHTTRHTELIELDKGGFVLDTPGFSSLDLDFLTEETLEEHFHDIHEASEMCKFAGCRHDKEPSCKVKESVESGEISKSRYDNYIMFLKEISERKRF